jgi:hypothetical protein
MEHDQPRGASPGPANRVGEYCAEQPLVQGTPGQIRRRLSNRELVVLIARIHLCLKTNAGAA